MAMTINTNVLSINAQRNAATTNLSLSTSLQRLSSGLRVNSAKDDAAGLAIANRMDAQARGMNVAVRNSNDGISLVQTAESGMAVIGDMLQRMRELAVQASNGTNTSGDLSAINSEYSELWTEINRTMSSVEFNGTSLLDTTGAFQFQIGANSGQKVIVSAESLSITAGIDAMSANSALNTTATSANAEAIDAIDTAIDSINTSRATLGAIQNRFNYTVSYLQAASENQQAARGRIMDADFAVETANLSRAQILQQAGTAMVAQANQLPQGVLALLR